MAKNTSKYDIINERGVYMNSYKKLIFYNINIICIIFLNTFNFKLSNVFCTILDIPFNFELTVISPGIGYEIFIILFVIEVWLILKIYQVLKKA